MEFSIARNIKTLHYRYRIDLFKASFILLSVNRLLVTCELVKLNLCTRICTQEGKKQTANVLHSKGACTQKQEKGMKYFSTAAIEMHSDQLLSGPLYWHGWLSASLAKHCALHMKQDMGLYPLGELTSSPLPPPLPHLPPGTSSPFSCRPDIPSSSGGFSEAGGSLEVKEEVSAPAHYRNWQWRVLRRSALEAAPGSRFVCFPHWAVRLLLSIFCNLAQDQT